MSSRPMTRFAKGARKILLVPLACVAAVLTLSGCSLGHEGGAQSTDTGPAARTSTQPSGLSTTGADSSSPGMILFTIGLSTDPHTSAGEPGGFGVVTGIATDSQRTAWVRNGDLGWFGGATWISNERILVAPNAPPLRPWLVYHVADDRLEALGRSPVPPRDLSQTWSPDGKLIGSEPIAPCRKHQRSLWSCYRGSGRIFLERADGSARRRIAEGHADGWTPNGELLVAPESSSFAYQALDIHSGQRRLPLSPKRVAAAFGWSGVSLGPPRWSADQRYVAAQVSGTSQGSPDVAGAIVVARGNGDPIRLITSPYVISMFAWSPVGRHLAYTTSGFPTPHQLIVIDGVSSKPRILFTTSRHFDWITWSPDARWLLLDDEHRNLWRLVPVTGPGGVREVPRLGGRPLWCCPSNSYAGAG